MTPRRRVILLSPEPPPRSTLQALDRRGIDVLTVTAVDACVDQLRFSAWHLCVVSTSDADAATVRRIVHGERLGVAVVAVRSPDDLEGSVVRALAGQRTQRHRGVPLKVGALRVDPSTYDAEYEGRALNLNRRQFRLLYLLALHAPDPMYRAELAAQLTRGEGTQTLRNVDALVSRLRARLLASTGRSLVITVRGVGYRLDSDDSHAVSASSPDRYRRSRDDLTTLGEWPQSGQRSGQPLPQSG